MHEGLWEKIVALDPADTARRAKCEYMPATGHYEVVLMGRRFAVEPDESRIYQKQTAPHVPERKENVQQEPEAGFLEQLCILAYLINARDVPLANKLVRAEALEAGTFFFRGPHTLPTEKLVAAFDHDPILLYKAGDSLGAKRRDYGDASIEISVLPQFPLTLVVWGADAEFSGRASILFDQTANLQLPLDAIGAAVEIAVKALINSLDKGS